MGELVFVCPWPAGGEKLGQVGEGGGRVPTLPFPFLGVGGLLLALCPAVDATAQPHLLACGGLAWFEPGSAVPDFPRPKGPLARLLLPCPPAIHPPLCTAPPGPFQPWTAFLRAEDGHGGVSVDTRSASRGAWHAGGII